MDGPGGFSEYSVADGIKDGCDEDMFPHIFERLAGSVGCTGLFVRLKLKFKDFFSASCTFAFSVTFFGHNAFLFDVSYLIGETLLTFGCDGNFRVPPTVIFIG